MSVTVNVNATEPMRTLLRALLICLLMPAAVAVAQGNPPTAAGQGNPPKAAAAAAQDNPLSANTKFLYGGLKNILLRSAEKMPEESYNFKPADAVRSFGQVVGHVADSQYTFCSIVLGEKNPAPKIEQTKTSKADLTAALKDAFAYCDKAYDGMTDASGSQMVKVFTREMPKLGVLNVNSMHGTEHYGNLVTYMRMKNIVPPTSDPEFQPVPRK